MLIPEEGSGCGLVACIAAPATVPDTGRQSSGRHPIPWFFFMALMVLYGWWRRYAAPKNVRFWGTLIDL